MKHLTNVKDAQKLSKNELQSINGGKDPKWCEGQDNGTSCGGPGATCCNGACVYLNGAECPG